MREKHILSETFNGSSCCYFCLKEDGAALLQHRDNKLNIRHPMMWGPPGGHVEKNETELICAKRELFEETDYFEENLSFLRYVIDDTRQYPSYKVALFWCFYDKSQILTLFTSRNLRFVSRLEAKNLYIKKFILDAWDEVLVKANISVKLPKEIG